MQVTVSRVDPKIAEGWKLFSEKKERKAMQVRQYAVNPNKSIFDLQFHLITEMFASASNNMICIFIA